MDDEVEICKICNIKHPKYNSFDHLSEYGKKYLDNDPSHYQVIANIKSYYAGMIHGEIILWKDTISKYNTQVKEYIKKFVYITDFDLMKAKEKAPGMVIDEVTLAKEKIDEAEQFAKIMRQWKIPGCKIVVDWILAEVKETRK